MSKESKLGEIKKKKKKKMNVIVELRNEDSSLHCAMINCKEIITIAIVEKILIAIFFLVNLFVCFLFLKKETNNN